MTGKEFAEAHGDSSTWTTADFEAELNLAEIDAQQTKDSRPKAAANRAKVKGHALAAFADALLFSAAIAAGIAVSRLLADASQDIAVIVAIAAAFGTYSALAGTFTDVFGPTIDRLRGVEH
ncbi:MAG: hypothetical protein LBV60_08985 [Streptomyces sp.]|jgi:hypothetical protein|nr:hypothetical protein [Streptomyces sp.]